MEPARARLRRFVSSGICLERDAAKHTKELERLRKLVRDEDRIKAKERLFKALGDANRLKILMLLTEREMCVCEVMITLGMTQSNASHHLAILERADLVKNRREGKWVLYALSSPRVASLIEAGYSPARR